MVPFLRSARFRLIMLVLLAVIPALGLIIYTGLDVRQLTADKSQVEAQRLVRLTAESYFDLITSGQQLLTSMAQLPEVSGRDAKDCLPLFTNMLAEFPGYTDLTAADLQGNIFCSGKPITGSTNIAGQEYFQRVLTTHQFTISDYQIDLVTHQSSIVLAHPAYDASGQLQAVVMATLDFSVLKEVTDTAHLAGNSVFFIIDRNGTVLVRDPDQEQWVGKKLPENGFVRTILQQKNEGTAEDASLDGVLRLYAFQPLRSVYGTNAFIAVGFPVTQVYAEADRLLARDLAALGGVASLALIAAWLLGDVLILRQVNSLLDAARQWSSGDFNARTNIRGGTAEFVRLADAFDTMAATLKQREVDLLQAEREAAQNATRIELQSALIDQREKERLTIARDLHDGPVQELTGATFALRGLLMDECPPNVAGQLEALQETLQNQINELRAYAGELRPPTLAKFGLGKAILSHLETFQQKYPGLRVAFEDNLDGELLSEELRLALFRIYQESLTNIAKHSRATQAAVRLEQTRNQVVLEIQDNGTGFEVPQDWLDLARHGHLGLVGIRERAEMLGGTVEIVSQPGQGTLIRASVPTV